MLGFDAEERLIQKLPHDFAAKVVWGSALSPPRYHERLGRHRDADPGSTSRNPSWRACWVGTPPSSLALSWIREGWRLKEWTPCTRI